MTKPLPQLDSEPWYSGITGYQWLVLAIASAGWIFDVYEGQIFNITRETMLSEVLSGGGPLDEAGQKALQQEVKKYGDFFLGVFLLGGTVGGLLFGSLADRIGRKPVMALTILMYSVFSGLTYFAQDLQDVAALRFLVAMGVGGEWAVAASLVAEVFPPKARAQASSFFHASSVLGVWLAGTAGWLMGDQWRYVYLLGVLPAVLVLWVRVSLREPESWQAQSDQAREGKGKELGSFWELLFSKPWASRAWLGMALAAVGLGSFWAITVSGQGLAAGLLKSQGVAEELARERGILVFTFVQTTGGGLGLFAFGPLSAWMGRKKAFILMHVMAFIITPITCLAPVYYDSYTMLLILLPIFGFFTLGMHAGYAVYFPELFPARLRATGVSFCFNGGRMLAALLLVFSGFLKSFKADNLPAAMSWLSLLFLVGLVVVLFMPETKGRALPE